MEPRPLKHLTLQIDEELLEAFRDHAWQRNAGKQRWLAPALEAAMLYWLEKERES